MNVLLTGAFGTLGCYVLDVLLERGHKVTCFDMPGKVNKKLSESYAGRVELCWGDIRDHALVSSLIVKQDAVIHLAAILPMTTEDMPELTWDVNVEATKHILKAISHASNSPVLVFASSISIYGDHQDKEPPRTADEDVWGIDHYTKQKVACEEAIKAHDKPWAILRVGVSIDAKLRHADKRLIKKMICTKPDNRLEYVHPQDVAVAMVNAAERPEAHNKVHMIGGGARCQVRQLEFINTLFGTAGLSFSESDLGGNDYYTDWMDTAESQRILEFQHVSFADFEQQMLDSMKWVRLFVKPIGPLAKFVMLKWLQV